MKNVTVSLDDSTYLRARVRAAEAGKSLSAIVRDFLRDFGEHGSEAERLHAAEIAFREQVSSFSGADRMDRETAHARP